MTFYILDNDLRTPGQHRIDLGKAGEVTCQRWQRSGNAEEGAGADEGRAREDDGAL